MYCTGGGEEVSMFSCYQHQYSLKCVMESVTATNTVMMSGSVVGITTCTRAVTQAKQYLLLFICDNDTHCRHGDDESNCEEGNMCLGKIFYIYLQAI